MTLRTYTLLSGGIDSTTTLARAISDFPSAEQHIAVTVNYGQRHVKEMKAAEKVAMHYWDILHKQINLEIINLEGLMQGMLTDYGTPVPDVSYADLPHGISPTYVSFRNGLMLSALAAKAQAWIMEQEKQINPTGRIPENELLDTPEAVLYCGVHADDGANWAYPDCTPEFIGSMANAIYVGTYHKVRLRTPLVYMSKKEVVELGTALGAPLGITWSCYKGEELHCGTCPTCRSRKEAFELASLPDPTRYAS